MKCPRCNDTGTALHSDRPEPCSCAAGVLEEREAYGEPSVREYATGEEIVAARRLYADDQCEVDASARRSEPGRGKIDGTWVQAWVWVPGHELRKENDQ